MIVRCVSTCIAWAGIDAVVAAALAVFAANCPELRVFHCAGMLRVTNVGATKLVQRCTSECLLKNLLGLPVASGLPACTSSRVGGTELLGL